jgi:uncharacterized protein YhbP (UPF0306 family)
MAASMGIVRSKRPVAAARMVAVARRLLEATTLCAIATVAPDGSAHINTAYFAYGRAFDVVWVSDPRATHSRNIRSQASAAIAVYDSTQHWGRPDRGIQLFGSAHEIRPADAKEAQRLYAARFVTYDPSSFTGYRFYVFQPRRLRLFHETDLGPGRFVTARVAPYGRLTWARTEIYRSSS